MIPLRQVCMTGITAIEVAGRVGKFTSKSVLQLT